MRGFTAIAVLADVWRRGRVVEGTSLLRKHLGLNLDPGFESLRLRQNPNEYAPFGAFFISAHHLTYHNENPGFADLRL